MAWLLVITGVLKLLRWRNRNGILILYLHSVVDPHHIFWQPLRTPFPVDLLRRQLEIISRHYNWLSLEDAAAMISGRKSVTPNGIVLTFDDGYRNNMTVALPVLERYSIKPVLYVATGMLNNRRPYWFERFDYAVQQLREPAHVRIGSHSFTLDPGDRDHLREVYATLRKTAKRHFNSDSEFYAFFNSVTERLEKASGKSLAAIQKDDPCSATLSDQDLRNLSSGGRATIGSHTVDHVRLDKVNNSECLHQLEKSKTLIEEAAETECHHFCYPNGNWNPSVAEAVAGAGYRTAVTTTAGFNRVGDDLYTLKRLNMPQIVDPARLLLFLSGLRFTR